ncbi:MAG TPA: lamin tail domain-containing protein, partial [Flavisolibacter sp.]
VYLLATAADLSLPAIAGYFVRIGNTQDEISLYRKSPDGTQVKLVDGMDGVTATSDNALRIRVTRSADYVFTLMRDVTGTGTQFFSEGQATDSTFTSGGYFGFVIRQSTSSFFQKHYFDDISITGYVPDTIPPALVNAIAISPVRVDVRFSEPVALQDAEDELKFIIDGNVHPDSAVRDMTDQSVTRLLFHTPFEQDVVHSLQVAGVRDVAGNMMTTAHASFQFHAPRRHDILITEIMSDPGPPVGLPEAEYIELWNVSAYPIQLAGWTLVTETATSQPFPQALLQPDSMIILSTVAHAPMLGSFGQCLGIASFPLLPDNGVVSIRSHDGATIHAVAYQEDWYANAIKAGGGWSLEMVDPANPCAGNDNWKASTHSRGGTPGSANSVNGTAADKRPPHVIRTYTTDSTRVMVLFSETLDSTTAADIMNYSVSDNISVQQAVALPPLFREVVISVWPPLVPERVYSLAVQQVHDCRGNLLGEPRGAKVGYAPGEISPGDLVINEILFNPGANVSDYVELYNAGTKVIDLSRVRIANRNSAHQVSQVRNVHAIPFLFFPGDHVVLTEDADALQRQYLVKDRRQVLTISSLPSFPDDSGCVVVLDHQGIVIDELRYSEKWHFPLLHTEEGVALERIDPGEKTQDPSNWHSAAATTGFGTPGYRNSQYRQDADQQISFYVEPAIVSPDHDGHDDFAVIHYQADGPGYVASITIFDAGGRPVRYLARSANLGLRGQWTWDGLDENQRKLPAGVYIVAAEVFHLQGKRKLF